MVSGKKHQMSGILIVWASREAISQIAQLPTIEKENPPFQLISTKAIIRFLYSNVLKFGYGFERYAISKDGGEYSISQGTGKYLVDISAEV